MGLKTRAVKGVERLGLKGPLERWRAVRERIHQSVCRHGFDAALGSFVQFYGSKEVDASLLMLPLVGFLPATDPRVLGTVRAIEQSLLRDGSDGSLSLRLQSPSGPAGCAADIPRPLA